MGARLDHMAYSLGIDLGTAYSAAATARDGHIEIYQLGELAATIPSILVVEADGEVLVGEAAQRRSINEPTRTAREFKRLLDDTTPIIVGDMRYDAASLLAELLQAIVGKVREQLGQPDAIVLTHPASYGAAEIALLEQAVREAGIDNVTFLTEPEAAAIHHDLLEPFPDGASIAVYDFGGGTFDAAILRKTETGFEQLGRSEEMERLGGIDIDDAIFTSLIGYVRANGIAVDASDATTAAALAQLRDECRRVKEALSSDTAATIRVDLPGFQAEVPLAREEFEDLIRPRIVETIAALARATESAGLGFDELDRVLLVGGSSRIPLVAEMVAEATGRPITVDAQPKDCVALGAAFVAERRRIAATTDDAAVALLAEAAATEAILATEPVGDAPNAADEAANLDHLPPTSRRANRRRTIAAAVIGGIALILLLTAGASGMFSGGGSASSPPPSAALVTSAPSVAPSVAASVAPTPSASALPTTDPNASPSAVPTPTPTPAGRQVRITGIAITDGRYVADYEVFGYTPAMPGTHMHFFFNTVPVADAGIPGIGPFFMYAGPAPFTGYKVSDKPAAATQMCILVANPDHSIVPDTGNCVDLP